MDNDHGEGVCSLKLAKEGKDDGDLPGIVLVDSVELDKGIKQEQPRTQLARRCIEASLVALKVEAGGRTGYGHREFEPKPTLAALV